MKSKERHRKDVAVDITQLRYFMEVARSEHVTNSAKKLHIAQPALTQSMHRLEDELGVELFERVGRNIRLTPAGSYLRDRVAPALESLNALADDVRAFADDQRRVVRVGIFSASNVAVDGIAAYTAAHDNATFHITQDPLERGCDITITTTSLALQQKSAKRNGTSRRGYSANRRDNASFGGNASLGGSVSFIGNNASRKGHDANLEDGNMSPRGNASLESYGANTGDNANRRSYDASPGGNDVNHRSCDANFGSDASHRGYTTSLGNNNANLDEASFAEYALFSERIGIAVPSTSPIPDHVALASLADERFICLAGSRQFRAICDALCARRAFVPHVAFESDSPAVVKKIIGLGLGVGFWPTCSWESLDEGNARLALLAEPEFERSVIIARAAHVESESEAACFYRFLVNYVGKRWEQRTRKTS